MLASVYFLLIAFLACVTANRVSPPTKAIKISFVVSKAAYYPFRSKEFTKSIGACRIKGWTAKSFERRETEVLMLKNIQQKLVVFGFRGTDHVSDWTWNLEVFPVRSTIGKTTFVMHRGFRIRYAFIAPWFEREYSAVPRGYTIVITGHSLGGAEATIAAVYAAGKLRRRPDAVITYGSPLVGQNSFKNYYNQVVGCDRTLRIAARGDLSTVVPKVFGYTHVCSALKVDGKTGFDFIKAHKLAVGYERGLKRKYRNANEINFGCDQVLN